MCSAVSLRPMRIYIIQNIIINRMHKYIIVHVIVLVIQHHGVRVVALFNHPHMLIQVVGSRKLSSRIVLTGPSYKFQCVKSV